MYDVEQCAECWQIVCPTLSSVPTVGRWTTWQLIRACWTMTKWKSLRCSPRCDSLWQDIIYIIWQVLITLFSFSKPCWKTNIKNKTSGSTATLLCWSVLTSSADQRVCRRAELALSATSKQERKTDRQTDWQTDRQADSDGERGYNSGPFSLTCMLMLLLLLLLLVQRVEPHTCYKSQRNSAR